MAEVTEATVLAGVREELEQLKVPGAAEATMETEWRDLDIDSLELVELVTALEDRFDVKIADGELKSIAGVGDAHADAFFEALAEGASGIVDGLSVARAFDPERYMDP